ncbi:DUF2256 domain-containing protein [Shewanella sp. TC10]|uniref:DUF2256 domain-containing protein n=1 Tax=Shewanella sp. TC10 TaxID=1419739 RepID=UPI00129ECD4F
MNKACRENSASRTSFTDKTCPVCLRPFSWRKKWHKDWANVKYCSKRCAGERNRSKHD